jgi:endonuclease YncB( thermonuclease family)
LRWRLLAAQAGTVIIDGDTIDIDGVRIRIVQIDTPAESHVRFLISTRRCS